MPSNIYLQELKNAQYYADTSLFYIILLSLVSTQSIFRFSLVCFSSWESSLQFWGALVINIAITTLTISFLYRCSMCLSSIVPACSQRSRCNHTTNTKVYEHLLGDTACNFLANSIKICLMLKHTYTYMYNIEQLYLPILFSGALRAG